MPEVSVIIPTYNRMPFLREAVDSVLQQTYRDFELIIVDDGSSDQTAGYLATLGDAVRVVRQENRGPSAARNRGIACANGEYLSFLDSDDLWVKEKLAQQVAFMKERDAVVSYTDEIWIRKGVRVNPKVKHRKYSGWIFERCLPLCVVSPSSVLMRRAFFDEVGLFDETLPACEDYDLWLRASLRLPFHYLPRKLIVKRGGHPGQLSAQWGLDVYRVRALQKLLQRYPLTVEQRQLVTAQLVQKCRILENGFRKRGKVREAETYRRILFSIDAGTP